MVKYSKDTSKNNTSESINNRIYDYEISKSRYKESQKILNEIIQDVIKTSANFSKMTKDNLLELREAMSENFSKMHEELDKKLKKEQELINKLNKEREESISMARESIDNEEDRNIALKNLNDSYDEQIELLNKNIINTKKNIDEKLNQERKFRQEYRNISKNFYRDELKDREKSFQRLRNQFKTMNDRYAQEVSPLLADLNSLGGKLLKSGFSKLKSKFSKEKYKKEIGEENKIKKLEDETLKINLFEKRKNRKYRGDLNKINLDKEIDRNGFKYSVEEESFIQKYVKTKYDESKVAKDLGRSEDAIRIKRKRLSDIKEEKNTKKTSDNVEKIYGLIKKDKKIEKEKNDGINFIKLLTMSGVGMAILKTAGVVTTIGLIANSIYDSIEGIKNIVSVLGLSGESGKKIEDNKKETEKKIKELKEKGGVKEAVELENRENSIIDKFNSGLNSLLSNQGKIMTRSGLTGSPMGYNMVKGTQFAINLSGINKRDHIKKINIMSGYKDRGYIQVGDELIDANKSIRYESLNKLVSKESSLQGLGFSNKSKGYGISEEAMKAHSTMDVLKSLAKNKAIITSTTSGSHKGGDISHKSGFKLDVRTRDKSVSNIEKMLKDIDKSTEDVGGTRVAYEFDVSNDKQRLKAEYLLGKGYMVHPHYTGKDIGLAEPWYNAMKNTYKNLVLSPSSMGKGFGEHLDINLAKNRSGIQREEFKKGRFTGYTSGIEVDSSSKDNKMQLVNQSFIDNNKTKKPVESKSQDIPMTPITGGQDNTDMEEAITRGNINAKNREKMSRTFSKPDNLG